MINDVNEESMKMFQVTPGPTTLVLYFHEAAITLKLRSNVYIVMRLLVSSVYWPQEYCAITVKTLLRHTPPCTLLRDTPPQLKHY